MSVRPLCIVALIAFAVALLLAVIWLLQTVGAIALLDSPGSGAIGFALLAMVAELGRRKTLMRDDPLD